LTAAWKPHAGTVYHTTIQQHTWIYEYSGGI